MIISQELVTGIVVNELLGKLADKSITSEELFQTVEQDWALLQQLLEGVSSPKAPIRYGCAKALIELKYITRVNFSQSFLVLSCTPIFIGGPSYLRVGVWSRRKIEAFASTALRKA